MSVFDAIKRAVLRAEGTVIADAYSSTDQVAVEMADLANEVAEEIAKSYDWGALTKVATITGTAAEAYDLPDDYDRMAVLAEVDDSGNWLWGYTRFGSVSDWQRAKNSGYMALSPGGYIITGGQMHFYPSPVGTATFPYVSKEWAASESDTPKRKFTADNDVFLLDERLLTLGLIWRWKAQKGLDYGEDLATYEDAVAKERYRDRGSYVLRDGGSSRWPVAYAGRDLFL